MAAIIPLVVGVGIAGALAFAAGGAKASTPPKKSTHTPKKKSPAVSDLTEKAIIAAMKNPAAIKALVDQVAATGDPVKLWNLGRTMLLNSKGNPTMQAAAAAVLAKAVVMAFRKGDPAPLIANALANGDAAILAQAAVSAAVLAPELAARLKQLADQLNKSGKTPGPVKKPGKKPASKDDANAAKAAQAATQVVADAIKATAQVEKDPPGAPVPNVPPTPTKVVTLPEVQVMAKVPTGAFKSAIDFTSYLESLGAARDHTLRNKENKKTVAAFQKALGLNADGIYGPGSATKIAQLGWVPVPPFYWTKGKADAQKKAYKAVIAAQAKAITDLDWTPAVKNLERS